MALPDEPITRSEQYLSNIAGEGTTLPDYPITRSEQYLNKIATGEGDTPAFPITREEQYLDYIAENGGGGGDITVEALTATENGTYNPGSGKAYKPVTVAVPVPASQAELDSIAVKVGGIATPSTPASIEAQAEDLIADANEATGEADETLTDAVGTLIASVPDEPVFQAPCGWYYKKNFVYKQDAPYGLHQGLLNGCSEIESLRVENLLNFYQFAQTPQGLTKLRSVEYPYQTSYEGGNTNSFPDSTAIDSMVLGSIGYPVTRINFNVRTAAVPAVLTIYCTSISAVVIDHSPIGENTTVIYRDSTTGEVIEA